MNADTPTRHPVPPAGADTGAALDAIAAAIRTHGWTVTDALLAPAEAAAMAAECQSHWEEGAFRKAAVGRGASRQIREDIRSDHVLWLEPGLLTPAQKVYFDRLEQLRTVLNRHTFLGLRDFEGHFATYPAGSFYARHLDRHAGTADRIITVVYYLNVGWQPDHGGQLRLYHDSGAAPFTDINPRFGHAAIFLAGDFYHEVLPAHRPRMSVTGWFRR